MSANNDVFDFLRSIAAGKKIGEHYLRQIIDLAYADVFGHRPTSEELQEMYKVRNQSASESNWKKFMNRMEIRHAEPRDVVEFSEVFIVPALKATFPEYFDRFFDLRRFSFIMRSYINEKENAELFVPIPKPKSRDDWDYEPRPIDTAALNLMKRNYMDGVISFVDFIRRVIDFHESTRSSNSIRTAGSFWDHFKMPNDDNF